MGEPFAYMLGTNRTLQFLSLRLLQICQWCHQNRSLIVTFNRQRSSLRNIFIQFLKFSLLLKLKYSWYTVEFTLPVTRDIQVVKESLKHKDKFGRDLYQSHVTANSRKGKIVHIFVSSEPSLAAFKCPHSWKIFPENPSPANLSQISVVFGSQVSHVQKIRESVWMTANRDLSEPLCSCPAPRESDLGFKHCSVNFTRQCQMAPLLISPNISSLHLILFSSSSLFFFWQK